MLKTLKMSRIASENKNVFSFCRTWASDGFIHWSLSHIHCQHPSALLYVEVLMKHVCHQLILTFTNNDSFYQASSHMLTDLRDVLSVNIKCSQNIHWRFYSETFGARLPGSASTDSLILKLHDVNGVKFGEYKLKSGLLAPIYIHLRVLVSHPALTHQVTTCCLHDCTAYWLQNSWKRYRTQETSAGCTFWRQMYLCRHSSAPV